MPVIYDAVRVSILGTCNGQDIVNVFHVEPWDIAQAAQIVAEQFVAAFKSELASEYTFVSSSAIDMSSENGANFTYPMSGSEQGTGGVAAEMGTSAIIRWHDTQTGRKYRPGRTFLGPLPVATTTRTGTEIPITDRTRIEGKANDFIEAMSQVCGLVIVHGISAGAPVIASITSASVSTRTGHLDSRRR